ncbi:MAG: methyl-accepting chemotaxis protein [Synergistaceae bacterium]|jgi:methyl-accepting chemotaxis protein|nr:methyl-accepting chemotaxis protein [Synergistaceae bacterium]
MSIRKRLILTFFICLCITLGSIAFVIFSSAGKSANNYFNTLAASHLDRVEERIETFMEPGAMSVRYLAELPVVRNSRDKLTSYLSAAETVRLLYANHPPYERQVYDEFIRVANSNANYGLVFMANDDGQYAQAPEGSVKTAGYDPRKRSWYAESMQDKNDVTITSPYLTTGGGVVCSIMIKTRDLDGKPLGLLGVDYSLESLTKDLDRRRIMKTGYLVVFDKNGRIMADGHHSDHVSMDPKDYPELRKSMAAAPDGILKGMDAQGNREYAVIRTLSVMGWKIAVVFDESELMESAYDMLRTIMITSGGIVLLAFAILVFLSRSIVRPIKELQDDIVVFARGDLSREFKTRGRDEIAIMGKHLQEMADNLKQIIGSVKKASNGIIDSAREFSALAEQTNASAENFSASVENIDSNLESLALTGQEVKSSVGEVADGARATSEKGSDIAHRVEDAMSAGENGMNAVRRAVSGIDEVAVNVSETAKSIQELGARTRQIQGFVARIGGIANQTNLLALNAAIEAARAGEAGRGFAVVAGEVRKLAEESNIAAKNIEELAGVITGDLDRVVAISIDNTKVSENARGLSRETEEIIASMLSYLKEITEATRNLATVSDRQAASGEEIAGAVQEIATKVESTVRAGESIRSGVGGVASTAQRMAERVDDLAGLADNLHEMLSFFRMGDPVPAAALSPKPPIKPSARKNKS